MTIRFSLRALLALAAPLGVLTAPVEAAVKPGDIAPPVRLQDQFGAWQDIAANYGRNFVALTFYPKDDTGGCTAEAKSVTATLDRLKAANITVYGVSIDNVASKDAFCNKYGLKHTLLADETKIVCGSYGTLNAGGVSNRITVIIDPARIVRVVDGRVNVGTHGEDILKAVGELRAKDEASALARLATDGSTIGNGLTLRAPEGWTRTETAAKALRWTSEAAPGVSVELATAKAPAEALTAAAARAAAERPEELRVIEDVPLPTGAKAVRVERTTGGDAPQYLASLRWVAGEHEHILSIAAPAARADDAARLLAALAASVGPVAG